MPQGGGRQGQKPRKQHPQAVRKTHSKGASSDARVVDPEYFPASVVFQSDYDRTSIDKKRKENVSSKENAPADKVLVSYQDFRSLKIKVGSTIMLRALGSSTHVPIAASGESPPTLSSSSPAVVTSPLPSLYLKIWPTSSVQKGNVVLNSLWKPVFPTEVNVNRSVHVLKDLSNVRLLDANQVTFSLSSSSSYPSSSDLQSTEFKSYLSMQLGGSQLMLTPHLPINISWKGTRITLCVETITAPTHYPQGNLNFNMDNDDSRNGCGVVDSLVFVYLVTHQTKMIFMRPSSLFSVTLQKTLSAKREPSLENVDFAGYKEEKFNAFIAAKHGLGFYDNLGLGSKFLEYPPRGMLICGPHGVGKSKLMREIANQFDVYTQEISQEMLLSNYIGSAESEICRIFTNAASNTPSIILMDNADLFLRSRLV